MNNLMETPDETIERLRAERDAARALADKLAEALRPFAERIISQTLEGWQMPVDTEWVDAARAALAEYDAARQERPET